MYTTCANPSNDTPSYNLGVDSSLETQYESKPIVHKKFIKKNKCIHTNCKLKNGRTYLF